MYLCGYGIYSFLNYINNYYYIIYISRFPINMLLNLIFVSGYRNLGKHECKYVYKC